MSLSLVTVTNRADCGGWGPMRSASISHWSRTGGLLHLSEVIVFWRSPGRQGRLARESGAYVRSTLDQLEGAAAMKGNAVAA
jgi:hypothetical protein